jgi:auxin efflux carrier family protein
MLASQLSTDKLRDLIIIPVIFTVQLIVSWIAAWVVSKSFCFGRRAANFVTAMSVFANANSLPPPLVLSLSRTLKGLFWDRIPGDNSDEVAARGIFYIIIFQQLSNLLRWSWGYHVLLAPKHKYAEYRVQSAEEGQNYRDVEQDDGREAGALIDTNDGETTCGESSSTDSQHQPSFLDLVQDDPDKNKCAVHLPARHVPLDGYDNDSLLLFPRIRVNSGLAASQDGYRGMLTRCMHSCRARLETSIALVGGLLVKLYQRLPTPLQGALRVCKLFWDKIANFVSEFMNPPLWAMLLAFIVASFPALQQALFEGEYLKSSITNAIQSCGNAAVPLMLVVLGANLAHDASAEEDDEIDPEEEKIGTKLLIASLIARMVIPTVVLAPVLVLAVKYINIAIFEDPIFVIVCFLLTGAPTALQLAQICQINNAFEKTMDRILFQSYLVW